MSSKGVCAVILRLAFEMDGDADVSAIEQPTVFNKQEGSLSEARTAWRHLPLLWGCR